jgi:hypothetical protein
VARVILIGTTLFRSAAAAAAAAASTATTTTTLEAANFVRRANGVDAVVEVLARQSLDRRVLVRARSRSSSLAARTIAARTIAARNIAARAIANRTVAPLIGCAYAGSGRVLEARRGPVLGLVWIADLVRGGTFATTATATAATPRVVRVVAELALGTGWRLGVDVVGSQGAHSLVARCWWE